MQWKGQNTSRTKQLNKSLVLQTLLQLGPMPRSEIADITHLTRATITYITSELIQEGIVHENGDLLNNNEGAGRKSVVIDIKENGAWVIGVHISMQALKIGLVNLKGKVLKVYKILVPSTFNTCDYLEFLVQEINKYMKENYEFNILGVGIGSSGVVDTINGTILGNSQSGWPDLDIISYVKKELKIPVFLDNYVSTIALGEKLFGTSRALYDFLYVYIGSDIGARLVLNGELYQSGRTAAGELGHMTYIPDGKECWCGNFGCLNRYASEQSILEELHLTSVKEILQALEKNDAGVKKVLADAGEKIGTVLASLINMIFVQRIVVGGTLSTKEYPLVETLKNEINSRSFLAREQKIEVEHSNLFEEIEIIGAGALVLWNNIYGKVAN